MASVKASELRQAIADAQLDFGEAETLEDYQNLVFKHLGPHSYLAELRRKMAREADDR